MTASWDISYLRLARFWAQERSKDPSTKVGAIVVRPDKTVVSLNYNGFPKGMADTPERLNDRAEKYPRVIHAEMNALLAATESLDGCTMFTWPLPPCDRCAAHMIQKGITRVVTVTPSEETWERYGESWDRALEYFMEAKAEYMEYDPEVLDDNSEVGQSMAEWLSLCALTPYA